MPQSLPTRLFLRHFAIHIVKNMATYLRFLLVVLVWLVALPYFIRQVWRFLFWFSDGGTPTRMSAISVRRNETDLEALEIAREVVNSVWDGTTPVTPLNASQTSPAGLGGVMEQFMGIIAPLSQTLNISASDPLLAGFFKSIYYGFGLPNAVYLEPSINNAEIAAQTALNGGLRHSLLSNVSFLSNMTRLPWLNQAVIDIGEGYLITIIIVVTFILVFLIREWVVQQQIGINMGAGFNADMAAGGAFPQVDLQVENDDDLAAPRLPAFLLEEPIVEVHDTEIARAQGSRDDDESGVQQALLPELRRPDALPNLPGPNPEPIPLVQLDELGVLPSTHHRQRDLSDPEVQLTDQFSAIWRRAGGDPNEVLDIIDQEGLGEQMQYWVDAMKLRLQDGNFQHTVHNTPAHLGTSVITAQPDLPRPVESRSVNNSRNFHQENKNGVGSDSWERIPKSLQPGEGRHSTSNGESSKSSGHKPVNSNNQDRLTATLEHARRDENTGFDILEGTDTKYPMISGGRTPASPNREPYPLPLSQNRPRATSDVPHCRDKSPLGRNNWTFSDLPDENFSDQNFNSLQENKKPNDGDMVSKARKAAEELDLHHGVTSDSGAGPSNTPSPPHTLTDQNYEQDYDAPLEIVGEDGVTRTATNWEEVFENNLVSGDGVDGDDLEGYEDHDEVEENPFAPDTDLPPPRAHDVPPRRPAEPDGIAGNVADWLWGRANDAAQEDLGAEIARVVQDIDAEAPFVPVARPRNVLEDRDAGNGVDPEVREAAAAAGLDLEADIEDAEDFDGIMELIGMRGPLFGLVQNAIFSVFLLGITIGIVIWIPYNIGRLSILLLANPGPAFKLPLRFIFGTAAFVQDTALVILGLLSYCFIACAQIPLRLVAISNSRLGTNALKLSQAAFERVMNGTVDSIIHIADSEIFTFSATSHEALMMMQSRFLGFLAGIGNVLIFLLSGSYQITVSHLENFATLQFSVIKAFVFGIPAFLARPDSWVISLEVPERQAPLDPALSVWGGLDRMWAILAGFNTLAVLGALYVKRGRPFSAELGYVRDTENLVLDMLNQGGGVMKVIFIISIEMLVFPLYCGLLLDVALLPLFEGATVMSRLSFTARSPLTSIFVHWFVGTCYMFHFALFVSMCRKIMRKGVLRKIPNLLVLIESLLI